MGSPTTSLSLPRCAIFQISRTQFDQHQKFQSHWSHPHVSVSLIMASTLHRHVSPCVGGCLHGNVMQHATQAICHIVRLRSGI